MLSGSVSGISSNVQCWCAVRCYYGEMKCFLNTACNPGQGVWVVESILVSDTPLLEHSVRVERHSA